MPPLLLAAVACQAPADRPPNVVLVVVDTLRADGLSLYGYPRTTSPALQALAQESVVFHRAYATAPWTKPSVTSLLTSRLPRDHGVHDWENLPTVGLNTLPQHLKAQGYATHAVVSHHAFHPRANQFHEGFDTFDVRPFEGRGSPHEIVSSKRVTDLALEALDDLEEPYFLWVHYFDPHDTYLPHPQFAFGEADRDKYDSEVAWTDYHLGRLVEGLRARRQLDRTVLAITADHGESFGDHGMFLHTTTLYEELVRVPLLLRAPGLTPDHIDARVSLRDLAPTLLALAGQPPAPTFQGQAWPVATGLLQPPAKPIFAETRRMSDLQMVIVGDQKLILDRARRRQEIYDLRADPTESRDLGPQAPSAAGLRATLDQLFRAPEPPPQVVPLDPTTQAALEALGYLTVEPTEEAPPAPSEPK
jgi:arylsulfatase A-like enzyme